MKVKFNNKNSPPIQPMTKKIFLPLFALALGIVSCERDDDEYISTCPEIKEMTFVDVETGLPVEARKQNRPVLERGKKYVATVEQSQRGNLLYKAEYNWSGAPEYAMHRPEVLPGSNRKFSDDGSATLKDVIYDYYPNNPADTIVFSTSYADWQDVKLKAKYYISANPDYSVVRTRDLADGNGTVEYRVPSWQYYEVSVSKKVWVE